MNPAGGEELTLYTGISGDVFPVFRMGKTVIDKPSATAYSYRGTHGSTIDPGQGAETGIVP